MMFKNNLKTYIFSILCAVTLAFPQLAKAQLLNQYIVTGPSLPSSYFFQPNDFEVGFGISASSGLPLTYASSNPAVATIVNNKIRTVGVGTFVLTLSQPGNATYNPAPSLSFSVTILQGSQTIILGQIPTKGLSDPDFSPGATATSGLPVTYSSSDPNVATIVAGQIHIVGAGSTQITVLQTGNANYAEAATVIRTFYVTANTQTITFPPINKNFGDPIFTPSATSSANLSMSYFTSSNPAVATVTGDRNVTIVGIGTSTITAYQTGSNNVQAASASTTLTVGKANQSISMTANAANNYNTADYVPLASASSGLPLTFTSSNTAVATIVAGKIHITGVGSTTITASQPGNVNYNAAPDVTQNLVIIKSNQSITFPDIASRPLSAPDFNPGATSTSGLAVVYTSSNPSVATIVANQIHIVGLGSTTITASQPGDSNFEPASDVIKGFQVSGLTQVITFPAIPPKNFGDANFNPGATVNTNLQIIYTSSNPAVATIVDNQVRIVGAGTSQITATQLGNEAYVSTSQTVTLTVNKANQTIALPTLPIKLRSDLDFDPVAVASSNLPVSYASSNPAVAVIVNSKIRFVGAGTAIITASQAGNANYEAALPVNETLTVNKGTQTINFPTIPAKVLGDIDFDPSATSNSGLQITLSSSNLAVATIVAGKIHLVGAGTSTITAAQLGDANYEAASASKTLTVSSLGQVITFPDIPVKSLTSPDFNPGATTNSGLPITYTTSNSAVATIVGGLVHIVGTGTVLITATQPGNATYQAAVSVGKLLTVNGNTPQTITFQPIANKPFNTFDFDAGAFASSGLEITYTSSNPAVATIVGGRIHIVAVGTTTITATQVGDTQFASATATATFTVIKANPTINFGTLDSKIVNDPDFILLATTNTGLPITYTSSNPLVATIVADNKVHIVGVGVTTIQAAVAGNANYNAASVDQSFSVSKGFQTITFPEIPAKALSSADFDPGATVNSPLLITYTSNNPAVATIVDNQIHVVGLGSTTITASQAGNANYEAAQSVSRPFIVSGGGQTVTIVATLDKIFGDADFDPGATANSGLAVTYTSSNPNVATIIANKIHVTGVGTTVITATQLGNQTYASASATSLLTVGKGSQFITFAATATKFKNEPDYDPGAIASSGLPITYFSTNLNVATIVGNKVHIVGPGVARISATQAGNTNFNFANPVDQELTVLKGIQTITFPDITVKGLSSPDFSPGATNSSGLLITYTSSDPLVATIVNGNIHIVGLGVSTITASALGDANFEAATPVSKILTVTGLSQTITFAAIPNKKVNDPDFDGGATVSTGLPITYTSSNLAVATIVAGKIHIVGAGTSTITATQVGNLTYAPASASVVLTVQQLTQTITLAAIPNKKVNDADFDLVSTVSTGLPITYTSSNLSVATVVDGKVHIVGAGVTTITATQAGTALYAPVSASVQLTVELIAQTITFPTIAAKDANTVDFDAAATASSGLTVTYTSSDLTVATIVAGKIHIVGPGTTTITATQAGNTTFAAATAVSMQLVVNKVSQTITFAPFTLKTPTDADFDLTATASSGLPVTYRSSNPAVATIIGTRVHIVAGGSAIITASQLGNASINAAPEVSQTLDVVYTLPISNFTVKATDETCKTSNNGAINISATQNLNYTATIIVNGVTTTYPFSTVLAVNNLQAGTYNVCITVAGQASYKQCFDVTIKEPKDLSVFANVKSDGNSVLLKLEGSELYRIELNGSLITTTDQEISLPLIKGNNIVKISSDKTCQGVITKTFLTTNSISLYPNPVKNVLNITTGLNESNAPVKIDIHALDGRLMHTSQQKAEYGQVSVDLSKLNKGLYVLTLTIGNSKTVHKIIKD